MSYDKSMNPITRTSLIVYEAVMFKCFRHPSLIRNSNLKQYCESSLLVDWLLLVEQNIRVGHKRSQLSPIGGERPLDVLKSNLGPITTKFERSMIAAGREK